jgi:hypothetical protein
MNDSVKTCTGYVSNAVRCGIRKTSVARRIVQRA